MLAGISSSSSPYRLACCYLFCFFTVSWAMRTCLESSPGSRLFEARRWWSLCRKTGLSSGWSAMSSHSSSSAFSGIAGMSRIADSRITSVGRDINVAIGSSRGMEAFMASVLDVVDACDLMPPGQAFCNDVVLREEIKSGCGYGLHTAQCEGRLILVKVFGGQSRNEHFKKNIEAQNQYEGYWHPNIACFSDVIKNGPSLYVVYRQLDPYLPCELMEHVIAQELVIGLVEGIGISLKTVVGIARAIIFLEQAGFPLEKARWDVDECFDVVSGCDRSPLLVIHAEKLDTLRAASERRTVPGPADWSVFNTLCIKIFTEVNTNSYSDLPEIHDRVHCGSPLLQLVAASNESCWSLSPSPFSTRGARIRRELTWLVGDTDAPPSLREIAHRFNSIWKVPPVPTILPYRQGVAGDVAHECDRYRREEIVLTPFVDGSAVFSYDTPRMMETCNVCGVKVVDAVVRGNVRALPGLVRR